MEMDIDVDTGLALARFSDEIVSFGGSQMALDSYPRCPICERLCEIEVCVVDQQGRAVHKSCYHKVSATVLTRSNYDEVEQLLQQAQELREIANRLIERSDVLIASCKRLTERAKLPRAG